jgi:hypothetical protein
MIFLHMVIYLGGVGNGVACQCCIGNTRSKRLKMGEKKIVISLHFLLPFLEYLSSNQTLELEDFFEGPLTNKSLG